MPSYMTPGVYVEEVPSQSKPIQGVGTSIAAFIGLAPGGPVDTPVRLSNWAEFERTFSDPYRPENGPFMKDAYLAHAVYGFFHNGGNLCWVVRVYPGDAPAAERLVPADLTAEQKRQRENGEPAIALKLTAKENVEEPVVVEIGVQPPRLAAKAATNGNGGAKKAEGDAKKAEGGGDDEPVAAPPRRYKVVVTTGDGKRSEHAGEQDAGLLAAEVAALTSDYVTFAAGNTTGVELLAGTYLLSSRAQKLIDGGEDQPFTLKDVEGSTATRKGMGGVAAVDEVTMVAVPDLTNLNEDNQEALRGAIVAHCEMTKDRMAILDAPKDVLKPDKVLDWALNAPGLDSKFATVYYPWIEVMDPISGKPVRVPPCGHVAGVWARTDSTRGVHKAPANEVVMGANGLTFQITKDEQGALNAAGINCIRSFPGRGIRVWGARTLSSDPEWRYINVRRLFNYISESIMEGTQWAVFEPNDPRLWTQLRISVTNFLTRVWRDGALFGMSPSEAFYVKCDAETNPPDMVEAGQVTVEIGIAPVKPAEFIVFRISQFQVGADAA